VGEDHRADQADPGRDPVGEQRRDPGQQIGAEEDAPEGGGFDGKAQVKPVAAVLDDEPS
jgi:hypothetical protein